DAATAMALANVDVNASVFDEDGLGAGNRSGSDGRYLIDGLPPGNYRVSTYDPQGIYVAEFHLDALFYEDASAVAVVARSSTGDPLATLVDFDLDQGGAIEGLIYHDQNENGVRDGGEPAIGGINVTAEEHAEPHRYLINANTLADGTYRFGGLPPGLDLRLSTGAYPTDFIGVFYDGGDDLGSLDGNDAVALSVTAGGTLTGIDFGLVLGGSISGRVVDGDGVPIAGTWVNASPFDPANPGSGEVTAADGTYTLHALLTGDHRVNAGGDPYRFEYWDDQTQFNAADPVSVTNGITTTGIDFVLPREPRIVSGPDPAFGDRDTTVVGITVTAENLSPGAVLELGGDGLTIQNLNLAGGTFTFDVAIAADAPLGYRSLSVVNDHALEDAADVLADAFEVRPGATGAAPSAERLYVADNATAQIRVYGTADFSLLGSVDLCCQPGDVAASPDGSFVYAVGGDRALSVIDTRLGAVGEEVARLVPESVGDLAVTADFVYTNDSFLQVVHFVDVSTWEIAGQIAVGASPIALGLNPAGDVLWVANRDEDTLSLIDVDAASLTLHQVLATVPLPAGASPRGLAFVPGGARAWVAGSQAAYVIDAALAVADPANALLHTLSTPGNGRGLIDLEAHPASGKVLAYIQSRGEVWVVDASAPQPQVLRTFVAGFSIAGIHATPDRLYLIHNGSHDAYAVDTAELLSSPALSMTRFDGPEAAGGPITPSGGAALALTPGPPPGAPTVTVTGGSPAANGNPFTVTLGGSGFAPDAIVWLRSTLVRGTVTTATATSLTVDFPALTPAGDHTVVVTNPAAGGGTSGFSSNTLQVTPPPGFAPTQEVYATSYGTGRITVFEPGGTTAEIFPQPYPSGISITPDGQLAFVGQLYASAETFE
ncbi:MAG: SdrD B-like domain-containing protein, partial [Thermoanaerobaculia bacterium]